MKLCFSRKRKPARRENGGMNRGCWGKKRRQRELPWVFVMGCWVGLFEVLREIVGGFDGVEDIEGDTVWVRDGEATIAPWVVFQRHDGGEIVSIDEGFVCFIGGGDGDVVGEALAVETGDVRAFWGHELK